MEYRDDVFSLALGLPNEKDAEKAKQAEIKYAEMAVQIKLMMDMPGWGFLLEELSMLEKEFSQKPEVYSKEPNLAHIHTGANHVIDYLRQWSEQVNSYLQKKEYEQAQKNSGQGTETTNPDPDAF